MKTLEETHADKSRPFSLKIDGVVFTIENPEPTGRDLLALVNKEPSDFFLVFVIPGQPDQVVEADEPFDLSQPGIEEFNLVSKARHFTIQIDETNYSVVGPFVTGHELLNLAGKDDGCHVLTQILVGVDDIFVEPEDRIDLSTPGKERFTIVAKHPQHKHFEVEIDGTTYPWTKETITTEEIIALGHLNPSDGVLIIDSENNERTLAPGEIVHLAAGMCFEKKVKFRRG